MRSVVPVPLDRNQVLRIYGGKGTRVAATSGTLWLSEEGSLVDHVLNPGDAVTLTAAGKALALAVRPSRAVVEIQAGVPPPRRLEVANADGLPGRRVGAGIPEANRRNTLVAVVLGFLARSLDRLCSLLLHPDPGMASTRISGGARADGNRR